MTAADRAGLLLLGGGQMGSALLGGLLDSRFLPPAACAVVERRPEARRALTTQFPGVRVLEIAVPADSVVLAVKPVDAEEACRSLEAGSCGRLLSLVAGIRLARLQGWLWPDLAVIRAMPNTPALVGAAASAVSGGGAAGADDVAWAKGALAAIGTVVELAEDDLDAVTALSGSGPAYVFLLAEALVEGGVRAGLDPEVAKALAAQTVLGAGRLLAETGEAAEVLRARVTSPNGTTAAAIAVLEERGVRQAILEAMVAAQLRSEELGRG